MNNYIKILIPKELKNMYRNDKIELMEIENRTLLKYDCYSMKLELSLMTNNVFETLKYIYLLKDNEYFNTSFQYGFYDEYIEWLKYSIVSIMKKYNIEIKSDKDIREVIIIANALNDKLSSLKKVKEINFNYIIAITKKALVIDDFNIDVSNVLSAFLDFTYIKNNNIEGDYILSFKNYRKNSKTRGRI